MELITSLRNARVKYLRSLRMAKYRRREGRYLAEGTRLVEEALELGAPVETLVYAPDLLVSERAQALVEEVAPEARLAVSAEVFASLSDRENPQGLAAVLRIEDRDLAEIEPREDLLVLVAWQLRDPGNLGAILRTAEAVGATGVVIVEPSVDLYDPQCVRATMGSLFALPVVRVPGGDVLEVWYDGLRAAGLPLLVAGSSAQGEVEHFDVDYRRPTVLLIGSERRGLPPEARDSADVFVRLPMCGRATSLNVSAATAALVYEVVRQRRPRDDAPARPAPADRQGA